MLNVKNQKIVLSIAKVTYKANIKRNILTVTAIILTTFLISIILCLGGSYWNTISKRQVRMAGMDYDIALTEPRAEQTDKIRSMENVKYAGVAVKCAIGSQYEEKELDKLRFYWVDEICWKKQIVPALEVYTGLYPVKQNEILLSQSALTAMGISDPKIGMELPISYTVLSEDIKEEISQTDFRLCGWYKDYTGSSRGYISKDFYEYTGVRQTDFTQGELKISLVNPLYSKQDIVDMMNEIDIGDGQIIDADYDTITNFCKISAGLLGLLIMVFFSGYLFIYNTMYIAVSKDIRYYGQLKTLGMTSVQLKGLIYKQMLWNTSIGIPLGLGLSFIVAKSIIPKILHAVNPTIRSYDIVDVRLWVFGAAAVFSFLTALISSNKPVKMAGDCSPVEALKFITASHRKNSRRRENGSVFSMARQNIFRDKKQAVVILLSLSIAVSLFLVVNVILKQNDAKMILNKIYSYDMRILNQTMLEDNKQQAITEDMVAQIETIKGVKEVRKISSAKATLPYQETVYGEYYKELYQSRYSPGNYKEDMAVYKEDPAYYKFTCRFIGIDEKEFARINEKMGNTMDKASFDKGDIALVSSFFTEDIDLALSKTVRFFVGEGVEPKKEYSIQIAGVIRDNPAYFAAGSTPDFIVSEAFAEKIMGKTYTELISIEYESPFSEVTEKDIRNIIAGHKLITYDSKLERYSEMKNSESQLKLLGGSIGIIILLLAVMNYMNMMAASIQNRAKEFAILEGIGMTSKQIKTMLIFEGGSYVTISLILAVIIGFPLSFAVFDSLNIYGLPYRIPWMGNLVLFGATLGICLIVPVLLFKKIHCHTIIEQLRENED